MADDRGLRWGILAPGGIAHTFVSDLIEGGVEVTAVGSRSLERAQAFAEEFGIKRSYGSYQQLVEDPDIDAVYVASPHPFHAEHAQLALDAGKHVLIEKPVALNAREARAIYDRAEDAGLVALEGMWTRFLPHMRRIRQIVADGTLGDVVTVLADHTQLLDFGPEHRINNPDLGGGALLDLGIYPISFAVDILGLPDAVTATAQLGAQGVDEQVSAVLSYDRGAVASTHSSMLGAGPDTASIIGTRARIDIDRVWYTATGFRVVAPDGEVLDEFSAEVTGRGMHEEALEVERLAHAGATTGEIMPAEESVAIMEILDAVRAQIGLVYPAER